MDALSCLRGGGSGHDKVNARTALLTRLAYGFFYASASASLSCSLASLVIIAQIKKKTGYLAIVASLTVSQLIYDSSFLMYGLFEYPGGSEGQRFVSFFGGLATTLWTNVLSLLLVVIIFRNTHVNVKKNYVFMALACFVPAAGLAAAAVATNSLQEMCAYNALFWTAFSVRLASIAFNVVCYVLLACRLAPSTTSSSSSGGGRSSSSGGRSKSSNSAGLAVRVLASRLKYYSLVQISTRSTEVAYELVFSERGVSAPDDSWSDGRWASFLFEALLCPAAGVGFLFIFLRMQPAARESAREICQAVARWARCCKREDEMEGMEAKREAGGPSGGGGSSSRSSSQPSHPLPSPPPSASPSFSLPSLSPFRASLSSPPPPHDPHTLRLLEQEAARDEATLRQLRSMDDDELMAAVACEHDPDYAMDPIPAPSDAL